MNFSSLTGMNGTRWFPVASMAVALLHLGALVVTAAPLSWSKAFSPNTIGPGSSTRLTFSITNNNAFGVTNVDFTDALPAGVIVAAVPGVVTDCPEALVTAVAGGSTISVTGGRAPASTTCTISVNVQSNSPGIYTNTTGDLTSSEGNSGSASADLTVSADLPGFSKFFDPVKVGFGGRTTLSFVIDNSQNQASSSGFTFTDALPAGMVVADPSNATSTCPNGVITANPGSSSISYSPLALGLDVIAAGDACVVSVDVVASAAGILENVSGELMTAPPPFFTPTSCGFATAPLEVVNDPLIIRKSFLDDPVAPGGSGVLEFTIINRNRDDPVTNLTFTDDLGAVLPGMVATGLPQSNVCGAGSTLSGTSTITLSNASLPPAGSCTFTVNYTVPSNALPGLYTNVTSVVTGDVASRQVQGSGATDTLAVAPLPLLTKEFIGGPFLPGGSATMRFTITNQSATQSATGITFTDNFPGGIVSATALANGFCGQASSMFFAPGDQFNPPSLIISGAEVGAGLSCSFDVPVTLSSNVSGGKITNTTEPIVATVGGVSYTGAPASGDLQIVSAPQLSKVFLDNPVLPGNTTRIQFTLSHGAEEPFAATNIGFTDDLNAVIPGLVAFGLPVNNICGVGSALGGTSTISFAGGTLQPGETCSFIVNCLVPANAPVGSATNTTSAVSATVGGVQATSPAATADLLVSSLTLTKEFVGDPVIPGGTVTVQYTLENLGSVAATGISFSDDLDDALNDLASTSSTQNDICGSGSSLAPLSGGEVLFLVNGSVNPGSSCTFSATVEVPANSPVGTYQGITSGVTVTLGGTQVTLPGAGDSLEVDKAVLLLEQEFLADPTTAGGSSQLEFTLTNLTSNQTITNIAFTDVLPGGLSMTGGSQANICGNGSQVSGGTTITFTGGSLGPGASCMFSVPVAIAANVPLGALQFTSSEVTGQTATGNLAVCGAGAPVGLVIVTPGGEEFQISGLTLSGNGTVVVNMNLFPGGRYCLQWSDNLSTWTTVPEVFIGTGTLQQWTDPGPPTLPAANGRRYYRLFEKTGP